MTYDEILAMFNGGTAVPNSQATGYVETGESGSYAPTGWETNTSSRVNGSNAVVFDPYTGQYIMAPSAGFNGSGGFDPGRAFTQYIANPDGTVTTQDQSTQSDWATLRPGLLAALGVAGAGALAGGVGAGATGSAGAAEGAAGAGAAGIADPAAASFLSTGTAAAPAAATTGAGLLGGAGASGTSGGLLGSAGGLSGTGMVERLLSNPQVLGAGLGALAGVAGSGDTTTSSQSSAPSWVQPYMQDYLNRANALSQQPMTATADQNAAFGQIRNLASNGDPLVQAARGQQSGVIGGSMLNSNPYIDQVATSIGDRMGEAYATGARANLATRANNDGNSVVGKSAFQQNLANSDRSFADSLGSTMSNLYYGNYANERQAQDAASRGSLGFSTDARANTEGLLNIGNQQQQWPYQQLGVLGTALQGNYGQTNTQTTPGVPTWQALLGGAAGGAGIARSVFGGQSNSMFGGTGAGGAQSGQSAPFSQYWNWGQ